MLFLLHTIAHIKLHTHIFPTILCILLWEGWLRSFANFLVSNKLDHTVYGQIGVQTDQVGVLNGLFGVQNGIIGFQHGQNGVKMAKFGSKMVKLESAPVPGY